jgi:hypothetical protein
MPLYMIQFAYTPEAKAALARIPEDRSVVFGQLVEDMGRRLKGRRSGRIVWHST